MRFELRIDIDAPPQKVWELCADPVGIGRLIGTDMTVEPRTPGQEPGLDGRYRVLIKMGAALAGGDVIIVNFTPAREFAWHAFTGVDHRFRLRLRPAQGGRTSVTLRFSYDAPGLLGSVSDLAAYPRLRGMFTRALEAAKKELEEGALSHPPTPSIPMRVVRELGNIVVLAKAGVVQPIRPDRLLRIAWAARTWGLSLGTSVATGAVLHPDTPMIIDERGPFSYADADRRTDVIARALLDNGLTEGDIIGVLTRNHRGFIDAVVSAAKIGSDVVLLNTGFSSPQVGEVCLREGVSAIIFDAEFDALLSDCPQNIVRIIADAHAKAGVASLDAFASSNSGRRAPVPGRAGRVTILTSGTTGTPRGANRGAIGASGVVTLEAPAALLDRIPLRAGMRIGLAAPMFHAWGIANLALGLSLGATLVTLKFFDEEAWLAEIERSQCEALIAIPVMLQRILELPADVRRKYDTSTLRVVAVSGSVIPGDLATRWMDAFGDNLYNLYGSTEAANATIATPEDLRASPSTAGRPTRGTTVKLLDDDGLEVPQGEVGRIFVGNAQLFEGYTGGGDKERRGGLLATGDLGRFDEARRLVVVGRDDDMIVSGGENVFPYEVENILALHRSVREAACIGVEDDHFGQRLRAFVVLRDGESVTANELKDFVRDHLARYKVPRDVRFVESLPRTTTGKVLKRELVSD
ncbi:AMP-binding protein [Hoyosella rhizosphaerae]|uniref:Fatty-acyl-CoA synthase n=1 Tax=Hoyosella rhizosphaerae TaxID=1755582 RepID=A0A916U1N5_9ACTN|nr:AMP-binding protein [Hoyosella rhizosphaerae]MBN4926963.1 AMP-binding protein [Hoyosella rhizosphaerae]GGC55122.1 fatty-acyl-CoA synthase [Hoyosella rhizosphaerae]